MSQMNVDERKEDDKIDLDVELKILVAAAFLAIETAIT